MADRPIIFSAPMVRALLAGRKTQTRRLATSPLRRCEVGDRLYVRESFAIRSIFSDAVEVGYSASERDGYTEHVDHIPVGLAVGAKVTWPKARPSIHMPRWASRLTLIVEEVRVQRLGHMSEADATAEGIYCERKEGWTADGETWWVSPKIAFHQLWNKLHGPDAWDANPFVVAVSFRVERANIDRLAA